jgi:hypothetical protein
MYLNPLTLLALAAALALAGCGKKDDPINQAAKAPATPAASAAGAASGPAKDGRPGIAEVKAIAEEAFIFGLPIVMNYAVMNEFVVDKNSGQYKGPFNAIFNESRVFTPKDTAVVTPNSDTPYSMLWLDLRAEPMVISVPAVDKKRYYSVQLVDGNTYNYGYIGSRATGSEAGNYLVVGPDWKGETPPGIKKVFQSTTPFGLTIFRTQLFNAADMPNVVSTVRSSRRRILPTVDFGSASTKRTMLGHLVAGQRLAAEGDHVGLGQRRPGVATTNSFTASPVFGSGTPMQAHSATPGQAVTTASTSFG